MSTERPHPLLAQVPLTVSPYVSLPTATTLPYTYKTLPPGLPPSSTERTPTNPGAEKIKPKFIVSSSGVAAHPDDIVTSCEALQAHLKKTQVEAEETLRRWQNEIDERELAEKRRVAPGWLDREEKILQPDRNQAASAQGDTDPFPEGARERHVSTVKDNEGDELDRAFGKVKLDATSGAN